MLDVESAFHMSQKYNYDSLYSLIAVKTPLWTGFHVVHSRSPPPLQIELESSTTCLPVGPGDPT